MDLYLPVAWTIVLIKYKYTVIACRILFNVRCFKLNSGGHNCYRIFISILSSHFLYLRLDFRRSSSRRSSRTRGSSQERRVAKRKRHAERTPPRRKDSSRRNANGRAHVRSSSSSDLREKKRYRCSKHGSEERSTKHRK